MKSKTSFFNKTMLLRDIKKLMPIILLETIGMLFVFVITLYGRIADINAENYSNVAKLKSIRQNIFSFNLSLLNLSFITCAVACVVVLFLFHYLYNKRASFSIHAFPITRKELFVTHYLAGIIIMIIPYAITMVGMLFVQMAFSLGMTSVVFMNLFIQLFKIIFFYSLMCMIIMICGNSIIAVSVYAVGNFLIAGLYIIFGMLTELFCYGGSTDLFMTKYMSFVRVMTPAIGFDIMSFHRGTNFLHPDTIDNLFQATTTLLWQMGIYAVVGLLFAALTIFLYEKRKMEKTGESLAFDWGYTIYRFVFTLAGGIFLSFVIMEVFHTATDAVDEIRCQSNFIKIMITTLVCAVFCYFIAEMILQKKINVLKQIKIVPLGITLAALAVCLFVIKSGSETRNAPNIKDIECISISMDNNHITLPEKNQIEWMRKFQKSVYDDCHKLSYKGNVSYISFNYCLKDGTESCISYPVPIRDGEKSWSDKLKQYVTKQDNLVELLFSKAYQNMDIDWMSYYVEEKGKDPEETNIQNPIKMQKVYEAVCKDIEEGNLNLEWEDERKENSSYRTIEFSGQLTEGTAKEYHFSQIYADSFDEMYCGLSVTDKAVNTLKALKEQ